MNKLLIITGLSFAGKTTLGNAIEARFGYEQVDVDVTKVQLYGPHVKDAQLSRSDWDRLYAETDKAIVHHLLAGKTVIDASRNFAKVERQHIRELVVELGFGVVTIYVDTPEAIVRQRLLENRQTKIRVDYPDADFNAIVHNMEPPGKEEGFITFHYADDIETWMTNILHSERLRKD